MSTEKKITAEEIDAVLPQTQCRQCGYPGCMPYAKALAERSAAIDLCPPGGAEGLQAIAKLLDKNPAPFIAAMEKKSKPSMRAFIREAECIGCTKCIQACPVDAIVGAAKFMHTVITDECTGCELCVAPCPVDCIEMLIAPQAPEKPAQYRKRYQARQQRLLRTTKILPHKTNPILENKKNYLAAVLLRAKTNKKD